MDYKTLPNCKNYCITRNSVLCDNVDRNDIWYFDSFEKAYNTLTGNDDEYIYKLKEKDMIEKIFVIGGEMLYNEAIKHNNCNEILINEVQMEIHCDSFFPNIDTNIYKLIEEKYLSGDIINRRYIRI
jgi:dihydrofolate reductase